MDKHYGLSSALGAGVVSLCAFDAAGACIARERHSALEAYTGEIDLVDDPLARKALGIRRVVAEQQASAGTPPITRWAMEYDENGTLTAALEHRLGARVTADEIPALDTIKLAQRLRWIGVPGGSL